MSVLGWIAAAWLFISCVSMVFAFFSEQHATNWRRYWLGLVWLWTRAVWFDEKHDKLRTRDGLNRLVTRLSYLRRTQLCVYEDGWGMFWPRPFILLYLTTYWAATVAGCGVVSLSRWWFERSQVVLTPSGRTYRRVYWGPRPISLGRGEKWAHPLSRRITEKLDDLFPGSVHGRRTGPWLWETRAAWGLDMPPSPG